MALLPNDTGAGGLTDAATTQGQQKTNFSALRAFLADVLGTDSTGSAAIVQNRVLDGDFISRPGASAGSWARGALVRRQSDNVVLGGAGFLGSNETVTSYRVGFGATWSSVPALTVSSSGAPTFAAVGIAGGDLAAITARSATQAAFSIHNTGQAVDNRFWDMGMYLSSSFSVRATNDANSVATNALTIDRTGIVVDRVNLFSNLRFNAAAPKVEHLTGGQVVGEVSFDTNGSRGRAQIRTRDTAGANARLAFEANLSTVVGYNVGVAGGGIGFASVDGDLRVGTTTVLIWNTTQVVPGADNSITCGGSGFRWSAVWAANGTIQTSDLSDKTDLTPIKVDVATEFVQRLGKKALLFRWLQGGQRTEQIVDPEHPFDEVEIESQETYFEEVDEPVFEDVAVETTVPEIEVQDGIAVLRQVQKTTTERRPVGKYLPVFDESGQPVRQRVGSRRVNVDQPAAAGSPTAADDLEGALQQIARLSALLDGESPQLREEIAELKKLAIQKFRDAQLYWAPSPGAASPVPGPLEVGEPIYEDVTHFVQDVRKVQVERTRVVKKIERRPRYKTIVHSVPGKRMHAGFGAQDVKAIMDDLGIDCGLWVKDDHGKQHLRPDQLLPFLAAALASALERIAKLEGK